MKAEEGEEMKYGQGEERRRPMTWINMKWKRKMWAWLKKRLLWIINNWNGYGENMARNNE